MLKVYQKIMAGQVRDESVNTQASIVKIGEKYNQFQHKFGQEISQNNDAIIQELFSPTFKKIANGDELVGDRTKLLSQLQGVKDFSGKWTILSQEIIPSKDNIQLHPSVLS